jgi:transcriptional regulator with XRE-family HTH domain
MERTPRPSSPRRSSLSDQLREIIRSRGTAYATAKAAGVDPGVVSRFLNGERGITSDTLDRIALALNLRLVEVGRRGPKPGQGRRAEASPATDEVEGALPG